MAVRQHAPPRLHIPPHLAGQQPALFSPALPSAIQQGFPQYSLNTPNPLQTPMQPAFFPPPPLAPGGRPGPGMHRTRSSVSQFGPPPMMPGMPPITPMGQGFPQMGPPSAAGQPNGFVPRSRRTMSVGGPPKAPLGGPGKQHNPAPAPVVIQQTAAPAPKSKKIAVNLPKETIAGEEGEPSTRATWAREPLRDPPEQEDVPGPEIDTAQELWEDPDVPELFVYLPNKRAWDTVKNKEIEEKLDKMGIERGSGSVGTPHGYPPHMRAASVSSPADPALLLFRLNKLQQSQSNSSIASLNNSPQPPSLSPNDMLKVHAHSMSLAHPPPRSPLSMDGTSNAFGSPSEPTILHAPQGRVPVTVGALAPLATSRPTSRPDFARGFGLDIPTEDTEGEAAAEAEDRASAVEGANSEKNSNASTEMDEPQEDFVYVEGGHLEDDAPTASNSRHHSRHVSKLSAALSLHAVGGIQEGGFLDIQDTAEIDEPAQRDVEEDAMNEWTGSEDIRLGAESSDDESIGEWSNPSDEERARQERLHRRMMRRSRQDSPRRIPNFPRPPATTHTFGISLRGAATDDEDVVSNPSEDGRAQRASAYLGGDMDHYPRSISSSGRPLPPLPHSRAPSGQYSTHDPAYAHSRGPSQNVAPSPTSAPALNPNAKPFVFGAGSSFAPGTFSATPAPAPALVASPHSRQPSLGKTLNASAPAFTPGGFNANAPAFVPGAFSFRPPVDIPQVSFTQPPSARPLPTPPTSIDPPRASQGREKRLRTNADVPKADEDDDDEPLINLMTSFKFPSPDKSKKIPAPTTVRRPDSAPTSPAHAHAKEPSLSASTKQPSTLSGGFAAGWPAPQQDENAASIRETSPDVDRNETSDSEQLPVPPQFKSKRAPIPLDFTHPVTSNTVPAGLFKALSNNSEERLRRAQHSRFGSRTDIFEHTSHGSLDDLNVVPISLSRKVSRNFTINVPPEHSSAAGPSLPQLSPAVASVFRHARRASFPAGHSPSPSSGSEMSIPSLHLPNRQRVEELREDLLRTARGGPPTTGHNATDMIVAEIHAMLRAQSRQLREAADETMRGGLDVHLIKEIVERGHARSMSMLQNNVTEILSRMDTQHRDAGALSAATLESLSQATVKAVNDALANVHARLQAQENARAPTIDGGVLAAEVVNTLLPHLDAMRTEPIDYDGLTQQLTQAVKPHISQLIDLASDKRETAGLIVESLRPMLASIVLNKPTFDVNALASELTAEVRRVVAPIDAHEIKEQVSDLVVERLDSRLAVRDRALNLDGIANRVIENVLAALEPFKSVSETMNRVADGHQMLNTDTQDLVSSHKNLTALISDLPAQLASATEALRATQTEARDGRARIEQVDEIFKTLSNVSSSLEGVNSDQKTLREQVTELSELQQEVVSGLNALPEVLVATTKVLDDAHNDIMSRDSAYKRDFDEVLKIIGTNSDLQVQLAKARGAHGQVRVEKDMLNERLQEVEKEKVLLRKQVEDLQAAAVAHANQMAGAETRNAELQQSLLSSQEKVKVTEAAMQKQEARLSSLDSENKDLLVEQAKLKEQLASLEVRVVSATKDKDSAEQVAAIVRAENERIIADQARWEELRRVTEQIDAISAQMRQANDNELQELRKARDQSQVLEGEHAALQKRFKEQEVRVANAERTALTARETLAQAQERALEWEKRAKEADAKLQTVTDNLEAAEIAKSQLETDLAIAQTRLDEKDADARLNKDREEKLKDQVALLEGQLAHSKVTLQQHSQAASIRATPKIITPQLLPAVNGNGIERASSPASTISRSSTPTGTKEATPPQTSTWDSMHAPKYLPSLGVATPDSIRRSNFSRVPSSQRAPSPTPSTVSNAPTLGEDGWWS